MKTEQTLLLNQVPALVCRTQGLKASIQKGTILFYHGLGASKEVHLAEIELLAAAGFLVVAVDAVGHGQRRDTGLEQLIATTGQARTEAFTGIVRSSAMELPALLDELCSRRWIYLDRIGIAGISMGGCICFLGITLDPRLKVAATILGSPEWGSASETSPHTQLEKFSSVRLQSQNAGRDEIVATATVRDFHARLRQAYRDYDNRFEYIEYPGSGHFMEEQEWHLCIERMLAWFDRQMTKSS